LDPLYIENPLAPQTNVTRNCFRIYRIQVCSRMLTYSHVCSRILANADVCKHIQKYADVCRHMQTYADVCSRMLTYAHVCSRMYADAQPLLYLPYSAASLRHSRMLSIRQHTSACVAKHPSAAYAASLRHSRMLTNEDVFSRILKYAFVC